MKQLFKKDSKGKIRVWNVWTDGELLKQSSGILDGKLIENQKECKGKNIGKKNETTPAVQASLEMQSKIMEKLDEGYFFTQKEAEETLVILPMLAKSYDDEYSKIEWTKQVFIQPKLDGMRCLAYKDSAGDVILKSRDGKMIENMDHIKKNLENLKQDVILDGELYCHGLSFQDNMKLIKKYRENETEQIQFHVYDVVSKKSFKDRFFESELNEYFVHFPLNPPVVKVNTKVITSHYEMKDMHLEFLELGYEGSIIRHGEMGYQIDSRSSYLLKYKDFQDIACEIIDIEPAEQRPEWGVPVLKYEVQKMSGVSRCIFRAGARLSHEERKEMLTNKQAYIGKTAEIRFFEWSDDGVPRFPVYCGLRLDK